jgi:hypothetical protein
VAADLIDCLGQAAPAAATDGAAYTVPANRVAVLSGIVVCNTGAATTYRVHVRRNGAAAGVGNAIAYDVALGANQSDFIPAGVTLGDTDVLGVRSASGAVTFTVSGEETDVPA